jgi:hypothetical protein
MYVIVRADGKFVTRPGYNTSYTAKLQEARTFPTKEEAERERCVENEYVRSVASIMLG